VETQDANHALKEASRKKLLALRDFALECVTKLKSKQGRAIRREKRATKLVATVMSESPFYGHIPTRNFKTKNP